MPTYVHVHVLHPHSVGYTIINVLAGHHSLTPGRLLFLQTTTGVLMHGLMILVQECSNGQQPLPPPSLAPTHEDERVIACVHLPPLGGSTSLLLILTSMYIR